MKLLSKLNDYLRDRTKRQRTITELSGMQAVLPMPLSPRLRQEILRSWDMGMLHMPQEDTRESRMGLSSWLFTTSQPTIKLLQPTYEQRKKEKEMRTYNDLLECGKRRLCVPVLQESYWRATNEFQEKEKEMRNVDIDNLVFNNKSTYE